MSWVAILKNNWKTLFKKYILPHLLKMLGLKDGLTNFISKKATDLLGKKNISWLSVIKNNWGTVLKKYVLSSVLKLVGVTGALPLFIAKKAIDFFREYINSPLRKAINRNTAKKKHTKILKVIKEFKKLKELDLGKTTKLKIDLANKQLKKEYNKAVKDALTWRKK